MKKQRKMALLFLSLSALALIPVLSAKAADTTLLFDDFPAFDTEIRSSGFISGDTGVGLSPDGKPTNTGDQGDVNAAIVDSYGAYMIPLSLENEVTVSFLYDGQNDKIVVSAGTDISLPACDLDGFVGWLNGANLYRAGSHYTANENADFTALTCRFSMLPGASVRTIAGESGIRFVTEVSAEDYARLMATDADFEFGTLILPTDYLTEAGSVPTVDDSRVTQISIVTEKGNTFNKKLAEKMYPNDSQEHLIYSGSLVQLLPANHNRPFSGRGYLTVTYADHSSKTIYTPYTAEDNSRDIYTVACRAYDAGEGLDADGNPLPDGSREVIREYVGSVIQMEIVSNGSYKLVSDSKTFVPDYELVTASNGYHIRAKSGADWSVEKVAKLVLQGKRFLDYKTVNGDFVFAIPEIWTPIY